MKNLRFYVITFIGAMIFISCGSSKKATTESDEVEVKDNECRSLARQKPSTRAWGEATNFDMSRAISFAEMNARAKFARAIASAIKSAQRTDGAGYKKGSTDGKMELRFMMTWENTMILIFQ